MSLQFNSPYFTMLDPDGQIVVGGKAYFYTAGGTFTTPKDVYSDSELTTPIAQPVTTDAAGRLPRIFMSGLYDVKLTYPDDTTLNTFEDYDSGLSAAIGSGAALPIDQGGTGATSAAAALTNLGAASQTQFNSLSSTVSEHSNLIETGLNEGDPTRFGELAPLDTIDDTDLIETDVLNQINPFALQLIHFRYALSSGNNGNTDFGSNTWSKMTINTTVTNLITSASITSSVISLPAGTYWAEVSASAQRDGADGIFKLRARDTTNSVTKLAGINCRGNSSGVVVNLRGQFTLSGTANIEIQGFADDAGSARMSTSSGEQEIYLDGVIWKVA